LRNRQRWLKVDQAQKACLRQDCMGMNHDDESTYSS